MSPSSAPRAKPLRTYSKRSATPSRGDAPPTKRRRISDGTPVKPTSLIQRRSKSGPSPTPAKTQNAQEHAPSPGSESKPLTKGSILNYFKPLPPTTPVTSSSPNSDEPERVSTPPSSPPPPIQAQARKKPRILRFRGASMPRIETDEEQEEDKKGEAHEAGVGDEKKRDDGEEEEGLHGPTTEEPSRPPLQDCQGSLSNQMDTTSTTDESPPKKRPKKPTPTVQTTLNISNQAPFSECKVCNTVWNPLYPDDVKFHTKQHAAALRAERKAKETEL